MTGIMAVSVIGGGTMGTGIAYVSALAGCQVTVVENDTRNAKRMREAITATAENGVERKRIDRSEAKALVDRVWLVDSVEALPTGLDLVIETVPENLALKLDILCGVSRRRPAVIASNTSALSIDQLSEAVDDRSSFLGMHFFNPVWSIKLVELIRGSDTSEATIALAQKFAGALGKESLVVRDVPGFATSRLDLIASLEAIRMLESGVASSEDIDRAAVLAYGHPMGPLRLSDIVGLDVRLDIARVLEHAHGSRFAPPQLLIDMVNRGDLGRKSGRGFFEWPE